MEQPTCHLYQFSCYSQSPKSKCVRDTEKVQVTHGIFHSIPGTRWVSIPLTSYIAIELIKYVQTMRVEYLNSEKKKKNW